MTSPDVVLHVGHVRDAIQAAVNFLVARYSSALSASRMGGREVYYDATLVNVANKTNLLDAAHGAFGPQCTDVDLRRRCISTMKTVHLQSVTLSMSSRVVPELPLGSALVYIGEKGPVAFYLVVTCGGLFPRYNEALAEEMAAAIKMQMLLAADEIEVAVTSP